MNEHVFSDVQARFGLRIEGSSPVSGGWLNLKWKVETDCGPLLVKQYSHERFNRRKLRDIEEALHRQAHVYDRGVPCPRVWQAGGSIIQHPSEDVSYMIMDFARGGVGTPETMTAAQMESLGGACALMHRAFSDLPADGVKGYPAGKRIMEDFRGVFRPDAMSDDAPEDFRETAARLADALERIPDDFADRLPRAIAHEDFTGDNMLFADDALSVILDFDRNQCGFPLHDIGRILMSLALRGDALNEEYVRAFMDGYRNHLLLTEADVRDALRLTFVLEAPWWLKRECFTAPSPKVARFVREIRWLGERIAEGRL